MWPRQSICFSVMMTDAGEGGVFVRGGRVCEQRGRGGAVLELLSLP